MKSRLFAALVAGALASTAALAQDAPPIPLTLAPAAGGSLATTFERSVTGLFVDMFTFTPASVAGTVSVRLTSLAGPVNFFGALLGDDSFSFFPESGQSSFSFQSVAGTGTPLSLTVFGYGGDAATLTDAAGRYAGSISVQTVAVIPEPQTYALMLAGLLAVGGMAARKRLG